MITSGTAVPKLQWHKQDMSIQRNLHQEIEHLCYISMQEHIHWNCIF